MATYSPASTTHGDMPVNILSDDVCILKDVGRIEVCALYCSELIARASIEVDCDSHELDIILMDLGIKDNKIYQHNAKIINQILL